MKSIPMLPGRRLLLIFAAGIVGVSVISILQGLTDLVHGAVYVLITGMYLLWLVREERRLFVPVGLLITAGVIVGYLVGHEHGTGPIINRLFSIVIFWIGVNFISRYKKLSDKEKRNREQLNAVFENVTEAILLVSSEGRIILGNPGAVKLFGFSMEELNARTVEDLLSERFREMHLHLRDQFLPGQDKQINTSETMFWRKKNGEEFPVELSLSKYEQDGETILIEFLTDITNRKMQEAKIRMQYEELRAYNLKLENEVKLRTNELSRALDSVRNTNQHLLRQIEEKLLIEEQLTKSQTLYKAVARNFPDGVVAILNKGMKYVFVEGRELCAFPFTENRNSPGAFEGLHKIVLDNHGREIKKAFEGEKVNVELRVENRYYDVVATPLRHSDLPPSEILIVIRNITRYKQYEEGLKLSLEKEKQLNVLKSKFVSNVSHEFRTPLSTILSSVFLIESYSREDAAPQRKMHITRIRRSVNLLTELLEDFLSLEKLAEGKVQVHCSQFNLSSFLAEFLEEVNSIKKPAQQISCEVTVGPEGCINSDKRIIYNILSNLVSNAIKYSAVDGRISVIADVAAENLILTVTDDGMGIPEKEQEHIFERFYRANNAVNIQGTGLGLNLVRKYARLLGGKPSFVSSPAGSTFRVELPLSGVQTQNETAQQETVDFI
jgi:PAS domain S-box-containing protein